MTKSVCQCVTGTVEEITRISPPHITMYYNHKQYVQHTKNNTQNLTTHTHIDVFKSYTICIAHQKQYIESNHTHTKPAACSGECDHTHHTNLNQLEQDTHKQETMNLTTDFRLYFTLFTSNALGCSQHTTSNQFSPPDMCIVAEFEDEMAKGGVQAEHKHQYVIEFVPV